MSRNGVADRYSDRLFLLQTITSAMSTLTPPVTLEDPSNQNRMDYILEVSSSPDFDYPPVSHESSRLFTLRQQRVFSRSGTKRISPSRACECASVRAGSSSIFLAAWRHRAKEYANQTRPCVRRFLRVAGTARNNSLFDEEEEEKKKKKKKTKKNRHADRVISFCSRFRPQSSRITTISIVKNSVLAPTTCCSRFTTRYFTIVFQRQTLLVHSRRLPLGSDGRSVCSRHAQMSVL